MRQCQDCGQELSYDSEFCPQCGAETDFFMKPAGFWIRVGAYLLDGLILGVPLLTLQLVLGKINKAYVQNATFVICISIPGLLYKPLMESIWAATLGKMICKIRVLDGEGKKLTIPKAYLRYSTFLLASVAGIIQNLWMYSQPNFSDIAFQSTLFQNPTYLLILLIVVAASLFVLIDCLCAAFNPRKRTIHDMMAGSFCVKKPAAELLPEAATDISDPDDKLPMKF